MILVDTSIWIDHLHRSDDRLVALLSDDQVGSHSCVVSELALGSIKSRDAVLGLLTNLWQFPELGHGDFLNLVNARRLWGRGLSMVDAQLLGSVLLVSGASLWTRDKRLIAACRELGVGYSADR